MQELVDRHMAAENLGDIDGAVAVAGRRSGDRSAELTRVAVTESR